MPSFRDKPVNLSRAIVVDTREQHPWFGSGIIRTVRRKLDQGDYALDGLESVCVIERKSTPDLVASTVSPRFERELLRLFECVQHSFVFHEGSLADIDKFCASRTRIPYATVVGRLKGFALDYRTHFVHCENRRQAQWEAIQLFESVERRVAELTPEDGGRIGWLKARSVAPN